MVLYRHFFRRLARRCQMWLNGDDSVLLVRRGAVRLQMVPYRQSAIFRRG